MQEAVSDSGGRSPIHHAQQVKQRLRDLADHLRADIEKTDEPQAKALFETSAEVLNALEKAFDHYEKKSESAWQ